MDESYATVWEVVADAIPDALAVVQGTRRVTHGELEQRAAWLAGALGAMGVRQGTHVALISSTVLNTSSASLPARSSGRCPST